MRSPKVKRVTRLVAFSAFVALTLASSPVASGADTPPPPESSYIEPTDCSGPVGYRSNTTWTGYIVPDELLGQVCIPMSPMAVEPPSDPGDWRVDNFTDEAIRARWDACLANPSCNSASIRAALATREPTEERLYGSKGDMRGVIDPHAANVDLSQLRRPAFYAEWNEVVADLEGATYTFEFSVPPTPWEQHYLGHTAPVKIRGWYVKGDGVPTGNGKSRQRAVTMYVGGAGTNHFGIQDPSEPRYGKSISTGRYVRPTYVTTEEWGARLDRAIYTRMHNAGFDVIAFDRRGQGYSGGVDGGGTFQEGLDMLRVIDAIKSGDGVRTFGPDGVSRSGNAAVRALLSQGEVNKIPVVLAGSSIASMQTQVAMNANFNEWCEWDLPAAPCHQPWGLNIKAALLFSNINLTPYSSENALLRQGAGRAEGYTAGGGSSETLANMESWPGVFIARGLFDTAPNTQPFEIYKRADAPKQIVFVRSEHQNEAWGPGNHEYAWGKAVDFAVNAVRGTHPDYPVYETLKEAVADSPGIYEYSHQPVFPTVP